MANEMYNQSWWGNTTEDEWGNVYNQQVNNK